jgi:extracellular factor (EF) 3-hydroxypalmitic acid methyl ester biosynthesis protein
MVFGPISHTPGVAVSSGRPTHVAREHVRAAAERLVAALKQGESLSEGWSNEALSFVLVEAALNACLASLAETGIWGRDNQSLSNDFWSIAGPLLECGPMQLRARTKPRGYAGDHTLFTWICHGRETHHPLGRQFDHVFQRQAAVEAVRTRTDQIAAAIATRALAAGHEKAVRLVSVGAGPAIDVERGLKLMGEWRRRNLVVTLLDFDAEALESAENRLARLMPKEQITVVRDNLYRLANKPQTAATLAEADVLICAGLFDYLADEPATELLRLFWRHLASGGSLMVGNFAPHCSTRAYMEWIGNWYLIYRTADELLGLAQRADIPRESVRVGAERLGIDLFLCGTKRA